jgi:hypothetical protein
VVTLQVSAEVLRTAKAKWDQAADELDGSWRRLDKASTDGFSSEVAAAMEAFCEPWVDELKDCAVEAQDNSEAIVMFRDVLWATDAASAERIRSLLPWAHHDAPISGA